MPYAKSAEQATFEWIPPLPFYSLGQSKYMCTKILWTQLKLDQNVVENKLIKRDNLWIKSYIRFMKIKSHFSGAHLDDKFQTFEVVCCIMVSAPIFRMGRLCEIPCWNHIRDSYTVLKPYDLTCWL